MSDARGGPPLPGYPVPPATMTDLYELTMAAGYWKLGRTRRARRSSRSASARRRSAAGSRSRPGSRASSRSSSATGSRRDELAHLEGLRGNDDKPLFEPAFLDYLADLRLGVDVDAMPEGTVVFPHEPLLRVTGSLLEAQLLETRAAQPRELPDPRGDQGGPRDARRRRGAGASSSGCAGRRAPTAA